MADIFTSEKRSWIMSRVKGTNTKPEVIIRSIIHRMGFRFRLHRKDLPGKPDIVLSRHKKVIFVHGCFWHGHRNCRRSARPSTNRDFWNNKLSGNVKRDKKKIRELRKLGWKVLVIWECGLKKIDRIESKLTRFLCNGRN